MMRASHTTRRLSSTAPSARLATPGIHLTEHPLAEDLVFTVVSIVVLLAAAVALFAPPGISFEVTEARAATNEHQIQFYGILVDEFGEPVKNAQVVIYDVNGVRMASCRTKLDGSWSCQFNETAGPYTVSISFVSGGETISGSVGVDAAPGMRYGVSGTVDSGGITFVPIPGY